MANHVIFPFIFWIICKSRAIYGKFDWPWLVACTTTIITMYEVHDHYNDLPTIDGADLTTRNHEQTDLPNLMFWFNVNPVGCSKLSEHTSN